jgi:hypothetical protein
MSSKEFSARSLVTSENVKKKRRTENASEVFRKASKMCVSCHAALERELT